MRFPAKFVADPVEGFPEMVTVRVPWLDGTEDGAYTCGENMEEAHRMAADLVDTWLILREEKGLDLAWPETTALPDEDGWELVKPSMRVSWALTLRRLRKELGISQAEAAKRLGITQPVYCRLEDPRKANPTLTTLEKISRAFSVDLSLEVA